MTGRTRMEPQAVVDACLRDLEQGVVVSIPGLEDVASFEAVVRAEAALARSAGAAVPATRYRGEN